VVTVCCDRLLLAHSENFIKLTFVVVKIFWYGCFAPPRLLRPGATAPLCPPPLPLSYAIEFWCRISFVEMDPSPRLDFLRVTSQSKKNYTKRKAERTSFSHLLQHKARKRSGSMFATPEPARGTPRRSIGAALWDQKATAMPQHRCACKKADTP